MPRKGKKHGRIDPPQTRREQPDGSILEVWADGFQFRTKPDGNCFEMWQDGTQVAHFTSGVVQTRKPDGYTKQVTVNGHIIERWPNGKKKQTNPDGSCIEQEPDGLVRQVMPNGIIVEKFPDGSKTQKNPDGTTQTTKPDGTTIKTFASGTVITKNPDGSMVQRMADGTEIHLDKNGKREQINKGGSKIVTDETGNKIHTHADGSQVIVAPDGSMMQIAKDGKKKFFRNKKKKRKSPLQNLLRAHTKTGKDLAMAKPGSCAAPTADAGSALEKSQQQIEELQFQLASKTNLLKKAKQDIRRYREQIKAMDVSARSSVGSGGDKDANTLQKAQFLALQRRSQTLQNMLLDKDRTLAAKEAQIQQLKKGGASADCKDKHGAGAGGSGPLDLVLEALRLVNFGHYDTSTQMRVQASLNKAVHLLRSNPPRTGKQQEQLEWLGGLNPFEPQGAKALLHVFAFNAHDTVELCALRATCKGFRMVLEAADDIWKSALVELTSETFGAQSVDEVLLYLNEPAEEDAEDVNKIFQLCARVACCEFIGTPVASEPEGVEATHIIIELGAQQVRIGANISDFDHPLCLDVDETMSVEGVLRKAGNMLMGSVMYFDNVDVMLILGTSFKYRRNEAEVVNTAFEVLKPRSLRLARSGDTALVALGQPTGIVVDIGTEFIHVVPMVEMFSISHASMFLPIGGKHVTHALNKSLCARGYALGLDVVERLKHEHCFVSAQPVEDEDVLAEHTDAGTTATLPDGSELILMQKELTECAEVYFDPSLIGKPVDGLVELVRQCIQRCAIDNRKGLFQNICLIGGGAALPGLAERLKFELAQEAASEVVVLTYSPIGSPREQFANGSRWTSYIGAQSQLESNPSSAGFVPFDDFLDDPNEAVKAVLGR